MENMESEEIDWAGIIETPDAVVSVDRRFLWAAWTVIISTPMERRDKYWDYAAEEVRRKLRENRNGS